MSSTGAKIAKGQKDWGIGPIASNNPIRKRYADGIILPVMTKVTPLANFYVLPNDNPELLPTMAFYRV